MTLYRRLLASGSTLLDGMQNWWELNEASGIRYDSVGGAHLSEVNTVGYGDGKIGSAAEFSFSNGDYLVTSSPLSGMKTLSFWLYNYNLTRNWGLYMGVFDGSSDRQAECYQASANVIYAAWNDTLATSAQASAVTPYKEWVNVIATNIPTGDGGDGKTRIWLNGILAGTSGATTINHRTPISNYAIGGWPYPSRTLEP
jgi:hypothetical protein